MQIIVWGLTKMLKQKLTIQFLQKISKKFNFYMKIQ
jgi:hypothetical protein